MNRNICLTAFYYVLFLHQQEGIVLSSLNGNLHKMKYSVESKREILDSFAGKFYSVRWIKADGSVREAIVKHLMHKLFAEGHGNKANPSTVANKPEMYTCVDTVKEGWVNVNLNNLKYVKCGKTEYNFED